MRNTFTEILGLIVVLGFIAWFTKHSLRKDKEYWSRTAKFMGLEKSPPRQYQKIADNLKWFIPYMPILQRSAISAGALAELEGVQHKRQTSLAMYEIQEHILGGFGAKAYFCVQRFPLHTASSRLFITTRLIPFMQVALRPPVGLQSSHAMQDFTVTFPANEQLWTKIEPVWQKFYDFCVKQKMGLLIDGGYVFLYSPYRPVDLKLWIEFSGQLLDVIESQ